jgi:hypothetical protein
MIEAKERLNVYLEFYNGKRPHQSLDGKTPDAVYFETVCEEKQAARVIIESGAVPPVCGFWVCARHFNCARLHLIPSGSCPNNRSHR